jgi:hypothetical protein
MVSPKEHLALATFFLSNDLLEIQRRANICHEIASDEILLSVIERTGFAFTRALEENGPTQTAFEFISFLIEEGCREQVPNFRKVIFNTYNKEWLQQFVYDLRFWQIRDVEHVNYARFMIPKA